MSISPQTLPEHILNKMSPEDRKALGKGGMTAAEAGEVFTHRAEKEMHKQFSSWLALNCIPFIEARMDRASTIRKGWPDYTIILRGRVLLIEMKVRGGIVSSDQAEVMGHMAVTGTDVSICESVERAIQLVKEILRP